MSNKVSFHLFIGFVFGAFSNVVADETALALFEQRIMPIFKSPEPSSCVQCHLSSVDLKDYILPSHEKTFVSLRDRGLIDLDAPEKSKILKLIEMGERDPDRRSQLIHAKTRKAEFEAFAAWVKACCEDAKLRDLPPLEDSPKVTADEVIRYNRKDRVLDSFVRNVWSQRMRCFPCHTPHEIDETNPLHKKPLERYGEMQKQFGARIDIFRKTPRETMNALILTSSKKSAKSLPLINLDDPRKSLLVLKPTSKLPPKDDSGKFAKPSSLEPVSHMGGLKMHVDDQSYKSFIAWITDYSRVINGDYESAESLPLDNWFPSKHILRIKDTPESWKVASRVQLFVHYFNDRGEWSERPIAFTQGTVTPKRFVNGSLFLLAPPKEKRGQRWNSQGTKLPPGKYLIRAYLDSTNQLEKDPSAMLSKTDLVGEVEIRARWREGFRQAEVASGGDLRVPKPARESATDESN